MSFSAEWLTLRAPADARARSERLMAMAAHGAGERTGEIVDLGSGTGATVRALGPLIVGPQAWRLVDADEALMERAEARAGTTLTRHVADLAQNPAPWDEPPRLVTASALFDLVSKPWIDAFADAVARSGAPLLALLTFDGRLALSPPRAGDEAMIAAFHTHQRMDKGFGPAAGPDAAHHLATALEARGYTVHRADSAWHLSADADGAMMAAILDGWAEAARELGTLQDESIDRWRCDHARPDTLLVGHEDLFAAPPG